MRWKKTVTIAAGLLLLVSLVSLVGLGQGPVVEPAELAQPIAQSRKFLQSLDVEGGGAAAGAIDKAYRVLLEKSPLNGQKKEVAKVIAATEQLVKQKKSKYGELREEGIELVKVQRIGDDLALLRFLCKFDRLPVVWYFTYYRTGGAWVPVGVRFDHEYELAGL